MNIFKIIFWTIKGKQILKHNLANEVHFDLDYFPYNNEVIEFCKNEQQKAREIFLITASHQKYAQEMVKKFHFFSNG